MALEEVLPVLLVVIGSLAAAILILTATRSGKVKNSEEGEKLKEEKRRQPPLEIERSVTVEEASKAEEELRTLNVEKEIVSYALTRLYEAEAEGKITEAERRRLVDRYKSEMRRLDEQIGRKQLIVDLRELEKTQADLVKTFHDKIDEVSKKIEEARARLGVAPKETAPVKPPASTLVPTPAPTPEEKAPPKTRKPKEKAGKTTKTKAEERIEAIQEEVLKVLERLEQIEAEA